MLLHYEHLPARGGAHAWRVGDEADNYVTDFGTEAEARALVKATNERLLKERPTWRYVIEVLG
jgi:uncharacterized protein YdbL (DUF1318 family)